MPMHIDGDIVLCGRSDETALRGYSGSLAELSIWDTALTAAQVYIIYAAVSCACCISHVSKLSPLEYALPDVDTIVSKAGGTGMIPDKNTTKRPVTFGCNCAGRHTDWSGGPVKHCLCGDRALASLAHLPPQLPPHPHLLMWTWRNLQLPPLQVGTSTK
jgi:hypothetical protein